MRPAPPLTAPARRVRGWQVVAAAAALAVGLQLWGVYRVTGPPTPPWFPNADKLEHLVGFGLPVALILLAAGLRAREQGGRPRRRLALVVGLVFVAHAIGSELIQHFFYTTRTGDPLDALADTSGVLLGLAVAALGARRLDPAGRGRNRP